MSLDKAHTPRRTRWWVRAVIGVLSLIGLAVVWVVTQRRDADADLASGPVPALVVGSPGFRDGGPIPAQFTCDGRNISPPLSIDSVPGRAQSLVIIMNDLNAPLGFVHWIAFNVPPDVRVLRETAAPGIEGTTDFGGIGYGGPCPPTGAHRYQFRVYALDTVLELAVGATRQQVATAAHTHVLAEGKIIGIYRR